MSLELDLQDVAAAGIAPESVSRWAGQVLRHLAHGPAELTVRIVDAAEGQALNRQWRGRDYATNVLSFPAELPDGLLSLPLIGDLVLCRPVVEAEARAQGKALGDHYAHLVVHGVLHLLGHDHEAPAEAEAMEALERLILAQLGVADPYCEPSGPV